MNPAAPSFLSRFNLNRDKSDKAESSDKEARKAERAAEKAEKAEKKKREKAKSKEKDRQPSLSSEPSAPQTPRAETPATAEVSPSESRKSKDNRSISTANDSTSGDLDHAPSDPLGGSSLSASAGKESFMQKLTRKSSSTKFPFNTGGLFSSSSKQSNRDSFTPDTTDEDSEVASKADVPQGSPMLGSEKGEKGKGSGRSWGSFMGKMGKKGDKTPSLSESFDSVDEGVEDD